MRVRLLLVICLVACNRREPAAAPADALPPAVATAAPDAADAATAGAAREASAPSSEPDIFAVSSSDIHFVADESWVYWADSALFRSNGVPLEPNPMAKDVQDVAGVDELHVFAVRGQVGTKHLVGVDKASLHEVDFGAIPAGCEGTLASSTMAVCQTLRKPGTIFAREMPQGTWAKIATTKGVANIVLDGSTASWADGRTIFRWSARDSAPVLIATAETAVRSLARRGDMVYFTDGKKIRVAELPGYVSTVTQANEPPVALAVSVDKSRIYWAEGDSGTIHRFDEGTHRDVVLSDQQAGLWMGSLTVTKERVLWVVNDRLHVFHVVGIKSTAPTPTPTPTPVPDAAAIAPLGISALHPGMYGLALKLTVDAKKNVVTGDYDSGTGDDGHGHSMFTCRFRFRGTDRGTPDVPLDVTVGDERMRGTLRVVSETAIRVTFDKEPGGCWNVDSDISGHIATDGAVFTKSNEVNPSARD